MEKVERLLPSEEELNTEFLLYSMVDALKLNQIVLSIFSFSHTILGAGWSDPGIPFNGVDLERADTLNRTVNRCFVSSARGLESQLNYTVVLEETDELGTVTAVPMMSVQWFTLEAAQSYVEMFTSERVPLHIVDRAGTRYDYDPNGFEGEEIELTWKTTPPVTIEG